MLEKIFIKNYKDTSNPDVRYKYGAVAGVFGIFTNLILAIAKLVIGIIGNSVTVIADAVNNFSDAGSSVATLFGFKMSVKPADSEHPYGHARYEYITALVVSMLVFAIGVTLAKSSIEKVISSLTEGETTVISVATYVILCLAIVGKTIQLLVNRRFSRLIDSDALKATAADSRNDIISTTAVLIASIIIDQVGDVGVSLDGIFGIAVSIFIIVTGIKLISETINPLLGEKPSKEEVEVIKDKLLSYEGVLGIHDLMIHNYGKSQRFVMVHVEVSAADDFLVAHDLIDNIEREFSKELGIHLSIHLDPVETDNAEVTKHKERITTLLHDFNERLTLHDFRMVFGASHTNILFDVVIPYDLDIKNKEIFDYFANAYKDEPEIYHFVLNFDREYV